MLGRAFLLEILMTSVYLRYLHCNMKGHNICDWTKVGERALCGKSCCGTYCKVHLSKIWQGRKIPVPCKSCGRGVQSDIQLCRTCGRDKVRHQHIALEKRVRHQFSLVLAQLLQHGVSWPSGLAYRTQVLVLAAECGFESRP